MSDPRIMTPEQAAAASVAAFEHRYHYRIELAITGRIRFLSHLEMVDTLLGALRRSGVSLALSPGMRPKPRIKVAMPRPVATEAWSDIIEVELQAPIDDGEFALALSEVLPAGLQLVATTRIEGSYVSAASRVAGATWRWSFSPDHVEEDALRVAVQRVLDSDAIVVDRVSPGKRTRSVDVRRFIGDLSVVDSDGAVELRSYIRLTDAGSAKPAEVINVLGTLLERELRPDRTIRESITIADPGSGGQIAEPSLVGAEVPDGPARPWGSC